MAGAGGLEGLAGEGEVPIRLGEVDLRRSGSEEGRTRAGGLKPICKDAAFGARRASSEHFSSRKLGGPLLSSSF